MDTSNVIARVKLPPEQYCAKNGLNYIMLEDVLLKDERAADVAKILYKIMTANRSIERWGIIYFGCCRSKLFSDMSRAVFFDTFRMVFPGVPKKSTVNKSIVTAEVAMRYDNRSMDNGDYQDIRNSITNLRELLDGLFFGNEPNMSQT